MEFRLWPLGFMLFFAKQQWCWGVRTGWCLNPIPTIKHNQQHRYGTIQRWRSNYHYRPKLDSYRKKISNALKLMGFKITIHTNLKIVHFLDITLNLGKGKYEPYKKDNDTPIYIHNSSNHPPPITKQIPKSISRKLSSNSSNIDIF